MKNAKFFICYYLLLAIFSGCSSEDKPAPITSNLSKSKLFTSLSPKSTGIDFNNIIEETKFLNYFVYVYLYNGGGVGIADINNDGLSDIYFTSTIGADKLYLNKGDFKFEDISDSSGISKYGGCKTGVTFVDINMDGWLDIYVCRAGWSDNPTDRENLFFINRKNNTFIEAAKLYGLNDSNKSIQSVFFDYDNDGDLDLYVSNHPKDFVKPLPLMIQNTKNPPKAESDKLFQNNGNGTFTNVSEKAGILNYTYSLGIAAADINGDGYTDVYTTSDFSPRDHYYVNNGDGTFTESLKKYFPHCSYFAMGLDITDINGDKNLDIFTGEMLAEDNKRQKTNMAPMDATLFDQMVDNGMHYQYMRNSFHLNNGNGHFSDVANFAGIDKSDWSWSSLFGDYDQDGDDDLLVVNGWLRDTQDKDSDKKIKADAVKRGMTFNDDQRFDIVKNLNSTPLKNYAFRYDGDLEFSKVSSDWGFDFEGFSSGMAYGDLDNDGDLDVVVNNMNAEASIYRNNSNSDNYLKIKLKGQARNSLGTNSKVTLETSSGTQYKEFLITRGFQSSCEPTLFFGLKEDVVLEKLTIEWPDGKREEITNPLRGSLTVDYKNATKANPSSNKVEKILTDITDKSNLDYKHEEVVYNDYKVQVLLPHKLSQLGPALSSGDINGDGLDDVFIGGSRSMSGVLYLQAKDETYSKKTSLTLEKDKKYEDIASAFFDVDGDKNLDLYVVSGSNEFGAKSELMEDRLYINDGKGNFKKDTKFLPRFLTSGSCVEECDFDNDGDIDLFVGGRLVPGRYPEDPKSYLLENTGSSFEDATNKLQAGASLGMVTAAIWSDLDGDNNQDLITVGEWTDINVFINDSGTFNKSELGLVGWWNSIESADLDNDGDLDFVVGNLGENYKYKATEEAPFEMFSGDFDKNGINDIVLSYYNDETLFPVRGFQCSSEQIPQLQSQIKSYEEFGTSDVFSVYGKSLEGAKHHKANCFSSMVLWNENGKLIPEKLPYQSQLSPIQDVVFDDVNKDGLLDILIVGNWFVSEVETPRADSGKGQVLLNEGNKRFKALPWSESGFFAPHDARNMIKVKTAKNNVNYIIANNNESIQVYRSKTD